MSLLTLLTHTSTDIGFPFEESEELISSGLLSAIAGRDCAIAAALTAHYVARPFLKR